MKTFGLRGILLSLLVAVLGLSPSLVMGKPPQQEVDITKFVELERIGRGRMQAISLSPDGTTLAVATSIGIWLYDLETLEPIRFMEGHTDALSSITWSPDGLKLASGSVDTTIRIWDAEQGTELAVLTGHTDNVTSLDWSPDGNLLASGSADMTVRLWDMQNNTALETMTGHTGTINSVEWSPDGTRLGSAGDTSVRIWDQAGDEKLILQYPEQYYLEAITDFAWSSDGNEIAAVGEMKSDIDGWLMVWDAKTGIETDVSFTPLVSTYSIAWQPGTRKLALSGYTPPLQLYGIKIIDLDDIENAIRSEDIFGANDTYAISSFWTADGSNLITLEDDYLAVRIWDTETKELIDTLTYSFPTFPEWVVFRASYRSKESFSSISSPDEKYSTVATDPTGGDNRVLIRESSTQNVVASLDFQNRSSVPSTILAWSPNNRYLAIRSTDTRVSIIDRDAWQPTFSIDLGIDGVIEMDWSPDSQFMVFGTFDNNFQDDRNDGSLQIWDVESQERVSSPNIASISAFNISWSPEGSYIVFTKPTSEPTDSLVQIQLWDVDRQVEISVLESEGNTISPPTIQWSSDGNLLAITHERTVSILDVRDINYTRKIAPYIDLEGHLSWITGLGWSEDGKRLATSSTWDGTVRIWGMGE